MPEPKDGDLALVRLRHFPSRAPQLARFRDIRDEFDGDGEDYDGLTWWQFFGTEITERPEDVEIVQRMRAVPEPIVHLTVIEPSVRIVPVPIPAYR